jgi:hypothetical protein
MPLEENVETLDGIDEAYHALYVENSEGTFDINITGLQSALTKERNARKKLEKQVKTKQEPTITDEELQNQLKEAQSTIKNMKIGSEVKSLALGAGIDPEYIDDVMALTKGNFGLDDTGSVVVVDADGDPTGQTVEKFFKIDYKKLKPRFYNGSGRSGSGSQGNLGNADPNSYGGQVKKAIEAGSTLDLIRLKNKNIK